MTKLPFSLFLSLKITIFVFSVVQNWKKLPFFFLSFKIAIFVFSETFDEIDIFFFCR